VTVVGDYGHLVEWYGVADVAIVCGSFVPGFGGHNPVEALASGARIVYGRHMREGDATLVMERRGYAVRACSNEGVEAALRRMLAAPPEPGQLEYANEIAEIGKNAASAYADLICEMLERRRLSLPAAALTA
jgi:3-deoxy-D-manno-octulosonic-acid transferase